MEEKRNEITVTLVLQREIAKKLAVTERTVQSALRFETNSPSAKLIRAYALNHGGKMFEITKKEVDNPYKEVTIIYTELKWETNCNYSTTRRRT